MKTILMLTNAYPFLPGEQFIEEEIEFWGQDSSLRIVIAPLLGEGGARAIPGNCEVDTTLLRAGKTGKLASMLRAVFSGIFYRELRFMRFAGGVSIHRLLRCAIATGRVLAIEKELHRLCKKHGKIDLIYSYWNDVQAFAAILAKRDGLIHSVFSRAHGFDVYEERRPANYMPLKRQFIGGFDRIFAVSLLAKSYLEKTYAPPPNIVSVSRLGVSLPFRLSMPADEGCLSVVSVSSCISLKRIDKIIDALAVVAREASFNSISWTHIGDGPLRQLCEAHAKEVLSQASISWKFLGSLSNQEVRAYLAENRIDLFINASETEGVPVSIMEAMACGIPAIAPDVGGIAELVAADCGHLLSRSPDIEEIAGAISSSVVRFKNSDVRSRARQKVVREFDAVTNYSNFVKEIACHRIN